MRKQKMWLAGATLAFILGGTTQAIAGAVYVPDGNFGNAGSVFDPLANLAPTVPARGSGERLVLDSDGSTVVAGIGTVWYFGDLSYLVVTRYGLDGQRQVWGNPTDGYTDDTHQYLFVQPVTAPEDMRIIAVKDVQIGPYGDINVLVDALVSSSATNTDSLVVTFGPDGAYKGTVTHMSTPGEDDIGAAIMPWGSSMFIVSSAGDNVNVSRYTLNLSDGVPALDTSWGTLGRSTQSLMKCKHYVANIGLIPVTCQLRARRALLAQAATTSIYVAGEYANDPGDSAPQNDIFIMHFRSNDGGSNAGYPVTWDSPTLEDGVSGLAFRYKSLAPQRSQNELYVLDAFPRPCRSGFIVGRFDADTGAFMNRTFTLGGGSNADPGVCASVTSLEAKDLILPQNYVGANRYLVVAGSRFTGAMYTGKNAFITQLDTQDLQATASVQELTQNASQFPDDAGFNAVTSDYLADTITATGRSRNYDGDSSTALTIRLLPDRIFRHGFEQN